MLITHQKASSKDCHRNATANQQLQRNTQAEGAKKQRREKGHTQRLTPVSLCEYTEAACAENPTETKHSVGYGGPCWLQLRFSHALADYLYVHYELQSPSSAGKTENPQFGDHC